MGDFVGLNGGGAIDGVGMADEDSDDDIDVMPELAALADLSDAELQSDDESDHADNHHTTTLRDAYADDGAWAQYLDSLNSFDTTAEVSHEELHHSLVLLQQQHHQQQQHPQPITHQQGYDSYTSTPVMGAVLRNVAHTSGIAAGPADKRFPVIVPPEGGEQVLTAREREREQERLRHEQEVRELDLRIAEQNAERARQSQAEIQHFNQRRQEERMQIEREQQRLEEEKERLEELQKQRESERLAKAQQRAALERATREAERVNRERQHMEAEDERSEAWCDVQTQHRQAVRAVIETKRMSAEDHRSAEQHKLWHEQRQRARRSAECSAMTLEDNLAQQRHAAEHKRREEWRLHRERNALRDEDRRAETVARCIRIEAEKLEKARELRQREIKRMRVEDAHSRQAQALEQARKAEKEARHRREEEQRKRNEALREMQRVRERAALAIQSWYRGVVCRTAYQALLRLRQMAAVVIQKYFRGYSTRRWMDPAFYMHLDSFMCNWHMLRHAAAAKIQAVVRGRRLRRLREQVLARAQQTWHKADDDDWDYGGVDESFYTFVDIDAVGAAHHREGEALVGGRERQKAPLIGPRSRPLDEVTALYSGGRCSPIESPGSVPPIVPVLQHHALPKPIPERPQPVAAHFATDFATRSAATSRGPRARESQGPETVVPHAAVSGPTEAESLAQEWGFKDPRTALAMLRRARRWNKTSREKQRKQKELRERQQHLHQRRERMQIETAVDWSSSGQRSTSSVLLTKTAARDAAARATARGLQRNSVVAAGILQSAGEVDPLRKIAYLKQSKPEVRGLQPKAKPVRVNMLVGKVRTVTVDAEGQLRMHGMGGEPERKTLQQGENQSIYYHNSTQQLGSPKQVPRQQQAPPQLKQLSVQHAWGSESSLVEVATRPNSGRGSLALSLSVQSCDTADGRPRSKGSDASSAHTVVEGYNSRGVSKAVREVAGAGRRPARVQS